MNYIQIEIPPKTKKNLRFGSISFLCLVTLSSLTTFTRAMTVPDLSQPKTMEYSLNNGLKVIIREDHRIPLVMTQIWYRVGSIDEPEELSGISHALEHLMFKGTVKVPENEFTQLSRLYGGKINAATFTNYSYYYQLYPQAYLSLALELEADRMHSLKFDQRIFETEMRVVMEERRQRIEDNPRALAFEQFKKMSYPTIPYRNAITGQLDTLAQLTLDDLKNWYKTWYQPNNAILVIVGDVDTHATLHEVQKYFGDLKTTSLPVRAKITESPDLAYRHQVSYLGLKTPLLYLGWNTPSLNTAHNDQDILALMMIRGILDSGVSSRLQSQLIRERKILSAVSVTYDPIQRGDTLFTISAVPKAQFNLVDIEQVLRQEIHKLYEQLISEQELQRVVNKYIAQHVYSQDDIENQAKMLGNLAINGLDIHWFDTLTERLKKLTPSDIQRVAQRYLKDQNLSSLHLLPHNQER